ncbi:Mitochondrial outer membrane protein iml2 [Fusarium falciforme]|nr:Mitochondrial outer membrane protein iml2 [Fusarium falciforme]
MGLMKSDKKDEYQKKAEELIFTSVNLLAKKEELGVENPLDGIATSPVHEIAYFYNEIPPLKL